MKLQKSASIRQCSFCKSEEGKLRPIGNYVVELKEIETSDKTELVCQTCFLNYRKNLEKENSNESNMKMKLINTLKKILFVLGILIIITSPLLYAQGIPGLPGFPDSPDPAPIDGGLGLLAAAGGAYAYKKLRGKKKEDELE